MVCLGRPNHFKFFKGCLPQILLSPFLNTLSQIIHHQIISKPLCFSRTSFQKTSLHSKLPQHLLQCPSQDMNCQYQEHFVDSTVEKNLGGNNQFLLQKNELRGGACITIRGNSVYNFLYLQNCMRFFKKILIKSLVEIF